MTAFSTQRTFAASCTEVFAAIEDPARLARWWGPKGFTNTFERFEFREGGHWKFRMIGPDGAVYPNESVFEAVDPSRRVVIRHACQPFFRLSIALAPSNGGTLLHWDQTFDDAAVAEAVRHIVEPSNEQNLDRLAVELGLAPG